MTEIISSSLSINRETGQPVYMLIVKNAFSDGTKQIAMSTFSTQQLSDFTASLVNALQSMFIKELAINRKNLRKDYPEAFESEEDSD